MSTVGHTALLSSLGDQMNTDPVAIGPSKVAFHRAQQALDELIVLALVRGPQKIGPLRAVVAPFGPEALRAALKRLQADGELVGEGQTQARIYRLVQRTSTPSTPAIRYRGVEYERVWPMPGDPKAAVSALADPEASR